MSSSKSLADQVTDMVAGRRCDRCETEIVEGYCMCSRDRRYAVVSSEITDWMDEMIALGAELPRGDRERLTKLALSTSRSALARARRHAALGERPAGISGYVGEAPTASPDHPGESIAKSEIRDFEHRFGPDPDEHPSKWSPVTTTEASHYPL